MTASGLQGLRRGLGKRFSEPVARLVAGTGVSPNMLTGLGFVVSLGGAYVLARGWFLAGGLLVLFSATFDLLDGAVARLRGKASTFGALLDSTLDRVTEAALLGGLLVFNVESGARLEVYLIFWALVSSVMVSYIKARAEGLGIRGDAGFFTRPERVLILALGLILGQATTTVALVVLAGLGSATALQRLLFYGRRAKSG